MKKLMFILCIASFLLGGNAFADYTPNLSELVDKALEQNHMVQSVSEFSRAEKNKVTSDYSPSDPSVGLSNLNRGNETEYITIQQKIRFPTKYFLQGKAQKKIYEASQKQLLYSKLQTREQIVNLYFKLYSIQKTVDITKTNLQLVKDFARIAEKKYASGASTQADSLKAHFEITQLEVDLLRLEEQELSVQSKIKAVLSDPNFENLKLNGLELKKPEIKGLDISNFDNQIEKLMLESSPMLQAQGKKFEAAKLKRKLAKWEFAPDFNVQYQQRTSGLPEDSKILSINASIPLWFWKKSADASKASATANSEESKYKNMNLNFISEFRSLRARVEKSDRILIIYKTTFMPQAEGAYRSTRSAYKAGKLSFLDLLDSERSLYTVQQKYYQILAGFVEDITKMESLIGKPISSLYGIKEISL